MVAKRTLQRSKAKSHAVSDESVANAPNGAAAAAPTDISSPKDILSSKTVKSSTAANGTPEKRQETSPKGRKRALPEPAVEQEPTSKKSKESPQATPTSTPKQESSPVAERFPSPPGQAATAFDKEKWQGYCEIENEPAFFSVILREIGVRGVTVRQVVMLEPDILACMPNPIFGLILLYRHREFDVANQEKACPPNIWFANQMPAQNSCATLAMIHTLLNVDNDNIDIGEHMRQFKDYSKDLSPFHRGQAFASWQFVKKTHNSFAKKMDIYQDDEYLSRKVRKAEKAKIKAAATPKPISTSKAKARRDSEDSNATNASKESFEDNAHHFIAFVPVKGDVWKLDGMDKQPTRMGTYDEEGGESWTEAVRDRIQALMVAGGDVEYSLFAIAQSPLIELRKEICVTDNTIKHVGRRLDAISTDWQSFVPEDDCEPPSPSWLAGFTEEQRAMYPVPADLQAEIDEEEMEALLARRAELVTEFRRLAAAYQMEEATEADEDEAAEKRRFDYQPAIKRWLEMLAENGQLEVLASRFSAN